MDISNRMARFARIAAALVMMASVAACANKELDPNAQLGANGGKGGPATPGSQRDFAQNVGDIVYFSTDQTDLTPEAQQTLTSQARWLQQYAQYSITIEGTPTSAAPANTISGLAPSAPSRYGISFRATVSTASGSARSRSARSARSRSVTTFHAGRRTAARRPC